MSGVAQRSGVKKNNMLQKRDKKSDYFFSDGERLARESYTCVMESVWQERAIRS